MVRQQRNSVVTQTGFMFQKSIEGFEYQQHNPFSYKPGGFARGAGHGATFQGQLWKLVAHFNHFYFNKKIISKDD
jgi:hypothetical protein